PIASSFPSIGRRTKKKAPGPAPQQLAERVARSSGRAGDASLAHCRSWRCARRRRAPTAGGMPPFRSLRVAGRVLASASPTGGLLPMSTFRVAARVLGLAALVLLAACATGPRITTEADPEADFSRYRTFGFYSPL